MNGSFRKSFSIKRKLSPKFQLAKHLRGGSTLGNSRRRLDTINEYSPKRLIEDIDELSEEHATTEENLIKMFSEGEFIVNQLEHKVMVLAEAFKEAKSKLMNTESRLRIILENAKTQTKDDLVFELSSLLTQEFKKNHSQTSSPTNQRQPHSPADNAIEKKRNKIGRAHV